MSSFSLGSSRVAHFLGRPGLPLALYILIFPCFLLMGLVLPPDWRRFGFQWQSLALAALVCVGTWGMLWESLDLFWRWFWRSGCALVILLGWVFLLGIGMVHGFGSQFEGLASGFLFSCLAPVIAYLCLFRSGQCHRVLLSVILVFMLGVEDIFLSIHLILSVSPNQVFLDSPNLPRLFINVRDGNGLAIAASVVAFLLSWEMIRGARMCQCGRGIFVGASLLWFLVFFNGWISQGRGLFLSIFIGLLIVFSKAFFRREHVGPCLSLLPVLAGFGCSWLWFRFLLYFSKGGFGVWPSMFDRLMSDVSFKDYGRLDIWSSWLKSGMGQSLIWGHGLGVKTPALALYEVYTPHNLLVQLLADSGLWGFGISVLMVAAGVAVLKSSKVRATPCVLYVAGVVLVYINVASVLFWPAGIWLVSLIPIVFEGELAGGVAFAGLPSPRAFLPLMGGICILILPFYLAIKAVIYAAL